MLRKKEGKEDQGPKVLARMSETERQKMFDLQFAWEDLVEKARAADVSLTGFRQFIRQRYNLPRRFTIDLATGVITEPPEDPNPDTPAIDGTEET